MPILNVKVSGQKNIAMTKAINELLLDLTHRILGKKKEVTAIAIEYVDTDCWFVGGKLLSEESKKRLKNAVSKGFREWTKTFYSKNDKNTQFVADT